MCEKLVGLYKLVTRKVVIHTQTTTMNIVAASSSEMSVSNYFNIEHGSSIFPRNVGVCLPTAWVTTPTLQPAYKNTRCHTKEEHNVISTCRSISKRCFTSYVFVPWRNDVRCLKQKLYKSKIRKNKLCARNITTKKQKLLQMRTYVVTMTSE
jgi:hypothetical protein